MTWAKLKLGIGVGTAILLTGSIITIALPKDKTDDKLTLVRTIEPSEKPTVPAQRKVNNQIGGVTSTVSDAHDDLSLTNIIAKARLAYASLSTYRDTAWTVHEYNGSVWTNTSAAMLGRKDCYRIEVMTAARPYSNIDRYRSDGVTSYHQHAIVTGKGRQTSSIFKNSDPMGYLTSLSGKTRVPALFFNRSWGNIFTTLMVGPANDLVRKTDEKVGDVSCYVIFRQNAIATNNTVREVTLWIGKQDFLVRRWKDSNSPLQPDAKPRISTETHENIFVNEEFKKEDYSSDFPVP